ncbi:DinB family protein [Cytobacillus kochii]|uniref:DinB family protein n=1 Tax=Cytobacillus kochii TaxID=859143 RepID=UPI00203CC201|nr:DinB family protein [Cytobacillus kochii]MCM3323038.1 DinB family protein [Cytobacillus kochii]MCM3345433.1 DinB family protein [Cytobacillus kochii]
MELREVLKEQLNASHHENGWFVSLLNSIVNLSDEEADWKPNEDVHSIHEITTHLLYYNERYLHRFKEESVDDNRKKILFRWMKG